MNSGLLLSLIILFMSIRECRAQAVADPIDEQKGRGMVASQVVIPVSEFNDDALTRLAAQYLSRYRQFQLLQVDFYTEERTPSEFREKSIDHISYEYWKKEFEIGVRYKSIRAATLLKYGQSAALRIRHANGEIKEIRIAGDDAFHPIVEGLALNVLHVSLVNQGFGNARQLRAQFYLKIPKRITAHEAHTLAKSYSRTLGVSNVALNFREDEWFVFDTFYPWVNPFTKVAETPPTLEETAKSVQFICTPEQDDVCFQIALGSR
jgi:hypothetical protein